MLVSLDTIKSSEVFSDFGISWSSVMVFGVFSRVAWFPVIPVTFLLAWLGIEMDRLRAQPPEAPKANGQAAEAEKPATEEKGEELSGFDLLEAYAQKVARLEAFQRERLLRDTDLQQRKSRAADELNRVIGGLKLLMEQEAERLFDEAMRSDDPMVRDGVLKQLRDSELQLQDVRRRAEMELIRRTVDGVVYPTLEGARQKAKELEEERQKRRENVDQQDLEDLEKLKQELLADRITKAAEEYAQKDAQLMLDKAQRLVPPQRRALLEEILRKYPTSQTAAMAKDMLAQLKMHKEQLADYKLHKAMNSPVHFDQRWRRLREIELYHPATGAAMEAKRISEEHLAQIPPVVITNHTDQRVELTVDVPYSKLKEFTLEPGQSQSVPSAFPVMIRVNIGDNEWMIYNARPAMAYYLQTTDGIPVLYCSP